MKCTHVNSSVRKKEEAARKKAEEETHNKTEHRLSLDKKTAQGRFPMSMGSSALANYKFCSDFGSAQWGKQKTQQTREETLQRQQQRPFSSLSTRDNLQFGLANQDTMH